MQTDGLAHDREKRRQETNLIAFVEFLIETQRALRESVKALPATASADAFAEPKRLQDELQEEIAPLKEKIKTELTPEQPGGGTAPQGKLERAGARNCVVAELGGAAGEKMASASRHLDDRQADPAAADQQAAIDELEKIWDAVIPFHPLLARDLADQTKIAQSLTPSPSAADPKAAAGGTIADKDSKGDEARITRRMPQRPVPLMTTLGCETEDLAPLTEVQERTLRRTQLLKLKAEAELERLEKDPARRGREGARLALRKRCDQGRRRCQAETDRSQAGQGGLSKSDRPGPASRDRDGTCGEVAQAEESSAAFPPAEEARKILEEIQKAQPKQDQEDKKKQEEDKKKEDQQKQDENKKNDEQQKQDQKDQQKKDQAEKRPTERRRATRRTSRRKDQDEQKNQDEPKKSDEQKQKQQQPQARATRSKTRCARSASGSRKSASETAR